MKTIQQHKLVIEHDELIDMRTHLTVAVLAAAQLRRTVKDVPGTARFGAFLDRALDNLVEDVRKVDALVAQAEVQVPSPGGRAMPVQTLEAKKQRLLPRLARAPLHLARRMVRGCCQWVQRRGLMRLTTLSVYD